MRSGDGRRHRLGDGLDQLRDRSGRTGGADRRPHCRHPAGPQEHRTNGPPRLPPLALCVARRRTYGGDYPELRGGSLTHRDHSDCR